MSDPRVNRANVNERKREIYTGRKWNQGKEREREGGEGGGGERERGVLGNDPLELGDANRRVAV